MAPVPYFERKSVRRKKVFTSHWMTSDLNFATVKRIEKETAKKEKIKKEKERISNETLAKIKKEQAIKKRKIKRKVVKKIKSNPKL